MPTWIPLGNTTSATANTFTYNPQGWPTTSSTVTTIDPWQYWSGQTTTAQLNATWENWMIHTPIVRMRPPTPEQRAEHAARRADWEARARQDEERRRAARVTAHALLEMVLSEAQLRDHQRRGFFEVISKAGRRYRINTNGSNAGNVKLMVGARGEEVAASLCAHLYGAEPHADSFIAQKLALEDDEDGFWAVANPSWRVPRESIEVPRPARLRALRERPLELAA